MKFFLRSNIFILLLFAGGFRLLAGSPDTAWTKTFGGDGYDEGRSVKQTTDGGYIITGYTGSYSEGGYNVYLIKTDSEGDSIWIRNYGGSGTDCGWSVQQTTDGGYIIAGYTNSYGAGGYNVYLIKTDPIGDTLWTKTFGGDANDRGFSVQQTDDGGYVIAGQTISEGWYDVYLIKTDSIGDTLWTRTFGKAGDSEYGYSVQQTDDGGYIITGTLGERDLYLIKTDSVGDSLWAKLLGGDYGAEIGYSVQQTTGGGYIVAGVTASYGAGQFDVYLIKTDSLGDTLWTKVFGGSSYDQAYSIGQTDDGGYIIAGYTDCYGAGWHDVYLIRTDYLGDTLWTKTIGGNDGDKGFSVQQTDDGGYIITGCTESYGAGGMDLYLIKLIPEVSGVEDDVLTDRFFVSPAYPNPFTIKTTLSYELSKETNVNILVYNLLGEEIKKLYSGKKPAGVHTVTWNGSTDISRVLAPSGIYFLKVKVEGKEISSKVMFVR